MFTQNRRVRRQRNSTTAQAGTSAVFQHYAEVVMTKVTVSRLPVYDILVIRHPYSFI
jgi:hypothetical protein